MRVFGTLIAKKWTVIFGGTDKRTDRLIIFIYEVNQTKTVNLKWEPLKLTIIQSGSLI